MDWNHVDPTWAWSEFRPSAKQPWTAALAAHLYRHAGFAASWEQVAKMAEGSPQAAVDSLFDESPELEAFRSESNELARAVLATGDPRNLAAWWLHRMLHSPHQLREKMTLFLHGHFATSAEKVQDIELMYEQNRLLREHALGDFARIAQGISRDPAMLIYLDSATNRKAHPNENYARELMELFCLGEGHYTERDVQELARCFTGWEIRRKQFRFNQFQHDFGTKTILGKTGPFDGEEAVAIVLEQEAAPRFLARKVFRFFVCDEPDPPDELLQPLAQRFREDDLHFEGMLRMLFSSNLFYSPYAVARKVRSPVDLVVGLLRALDGSTNVRMLAEETARLGQSLFYPPNVKGWDGGRAWINSATLLGRANAMRRIISDGNTRFGRGGLRALAQRNAAAEPEALVDWLSAVLLAVEPPAAVRSDLAALAARSDSEPNCREVLYTLTTLPEFQLG